MEIIVIESRVNRDQETIGNISTQQHFRRQMLGKGAPKISKGLSLTSGHWGSRVKGMG